jgi:hypothetical protein
MTLFGRGGIVTRAMTERAQCDVYRELERAGLATAQLARVRVVSTWLQFDARVGLYRPDDHGGTIVVPAVSLGRIAEYRARAPWTSVRDVLRHEYAHALADHHAGLVRGTRFERVFGGAHDDERSAGAFDPAAHVSAYAATLPSEDFAETVMLFLRVRGRIERFRPRAALHARLRFVASCASRLAFRA